MIYNVQILRVIAAYSIVAIHLFGLNEIIPFIREKPDLLRAGTDLFMICAGFLTFYVANLKESNWQDFFTKRAIRIVPLYWIVTIFIAVTGLSRILYGEVIEDIYGAFIKSMMFIPYENVNGLVFPLVRVAWTLLYIVEFTMIVGLSLLLSRRYSAAICSAAIVLLVACGLLFRPESAALRFLTDLTILDFLWGIIIFILYRKTRTAAVARVPLVLTAAGLLCVALAALYVGSDNWASPSRSIRLGIPAAMVVVAVLMLERARIVLQSRAVDRLSRISYALYLTHVLPCVVVLKLWAAVPLDSVVLDVLFLAAAFAASTCLAFVVYRFVEKPLTDMLLRRTQASA